MGAVRKIHRETAGVQNRSLALPGISYYAEKCNGNREKNLRMNHKHKTVRENRLSLTVFLTQFNLSARRMRCFWCAMNSAAPVMSNAPSAACAG